VAVIKADSRMTFSKPVSLSHCAEFAIKANFLHSPVVYHSHQPVTEERPLCWSVNQASLRDEQSVVC